MELTVTIASTSSDGSIETRSTTVSPSCRASASSRHPRACPPSAVSSSSEFEDTLTFHRGVDRASTFWFQVPVRLTMHGHRRRRRRESNMSTASHAPPISLYNGQHGLRRVYARRRGDTSDALMGRGFSAGNSVATCSRRVGWRWAR